MSCWESELEDRWLWGTIPQINRHGETCTQPSGQSNNSWIAYPVLHFLNLAALPFYNVIHSSETPFAAMNSFSQQYFFFKKRVVLNKYMELLSICLTCCCMRIKRMQFESCYSLRWCKSFYVEENIWFPESLAHFIVERLRNQFLDT